MPKLVLSLTRADTDDEDLGLRIGDPFFSGSGLLATFDKGTRVLTLHELSPTLGVVLGEVELLPSDVAVANLAAVFGAAPAPKPVGPAPMPEFWRGEGWVARVMSGAVPGIEVNEDVPTPADALSGAFNAPRI